MSAHHVRLVGGIVIWTIRGFKTSIKDCMNDYIKSFVVGVLIIIVLFYFGIYLYSKIYP